ncbi:MAG: rRNA maturation RNase YbeY [Candidatus Omnitrophica bacterium]|nr:rRNA maturation RNase YbeY [Candidatus Omnitrophota bacterium]
MTIDIKNSQRIKVDIIQLKKLANFVFWQQSVKDGYLSVILVNDETIRGINKKYLQIDESTDVLCFDLREKNRFVGDIIISVETAYRKAEELNCRLENELFLYLTHGVLHLLGYDDSTAKECLRMERRQEELVGKFIASYKSQAAGRKKKI